MRAYPEVMPAIGDVLAGRYRIDARLGAGGMATVWRARDLRLERDVAVKVLLPNLAGDPAFAARFDREAGALAAVNDPHVVAIHDVVPASNGTEPFLVMELCPGGSLGDRLVAGRALPTSDALPLLADAGAGLAALHAAGIVHRDVTPRNVLLAGGAARLGDLGLARPEVATTTPVDGHTAAGTAVGTLGYLAPEILDGRTATPASDVYGLGAVAYRTLTGMLPHPAGSLAELVAARERPVVAVGGLVPGLPDAVAAAIMRALDADPAARPTAAEMARVLRDPVRSSADEQTALDIRHAPASSPAATPPVLPTGSDAGTVDRPPQSPGKRRRGRGDRKSLPKASTGYHGPGLWSGELVAIVVIALAIVVFLILLGGRPTGGSGSTPGPAESPTASSGATPTASPSAAHSPRLTATAPPTVDPFAAAAALVGPVRAAIDAAKGPGGLKGKEAKDLDDLLSSMANALERDDAAKARGSAADLDARVRALLEAGAVTGDAAVRLASAVAELVAGVKALR